MHRSTDWARHRQKPSPANTLHATRLPEHSLSPGVSDSALTSQSQTTSSQSVLLEDDCLGPWTERRYDPWWLDERPRMKLENVFFRSQKPIKTSHQPSPAPKVFFEARGKLVGCRDHSGSEFNLADEVKWLDQGKEARLCLVKGWRTTRPSRPRSTPPITIWAYYDDTTRRIEHDICDSQLLVPFRSSGAETRLSVRSTSAEGSNVKFHDGDQLNSTLVTQVDYSFASSDDAANFRSILLSTNEPVIYAVSSAELWSRGSASALPIKIQSSGHEFLQLQQFGYSEIEPGSEYEFAMISYASSCEACSVEFRLGSLSNQPQMEIVKADSACIALLNVKVAVSNAAKTENMTNLIPYLGTTAGREEHIVDLTIRFESLDNYSRFLRTVRGTRAYDVQSLSSKLFKELDNLHSYPLKKLQNDPPKVGGIDLVLGLPSPSLTRPPSPLEEKQFIHEQRYPHPFPSRFSRKTGNFNFKIHREPEDAIETASVQETITTGDMRAIESLREEEMVESQPILQAASTCDRLKVNQLHKLQNDDESASNLSPDSPLSYHETPTVTFSQATAKVMPLHQDYELLIHDYARTHANKVPTRFTVELEMRNFITSQLDGDNDLSNVIVIIGDLNHAFATTCGAYVLQTWGAIGVMALEQITKLGTTDHVFSRDLVIAPSEFGHRVSLFTRQPDTAKIIETIAWLAATFRVPLDGPPRCSHLSIVQDSSGLNIMLQPLDKGSLDSESTSGSATCWHRLLPNTNIASGFPMMAREPPGLELSLDIMLDLADTIHATDLSSLHNTSSLADSRATDCEVYDTDETPKEHGIFFSGAGSLLYPVRWHPGKDAVMMWHFDDSGIAAVPPPEWLRVDTYETFSNAVHILGFTPQAKVHLGTRDRLKTFDHMTRTTAEKEKDRCEFSFENTSLVVGQNPLQLSFGGKIKFTRGQRAIVDSEKRKYDQILRATQKQPVILYDHGIEKVGWLVSQLSTILELVNYRIHDMNWSCIPEYANAQADGGAAAADVFCKLDVADHILCRLIDDGSDFKVKDLVKEIYVAMSKRRTADEISAKGTLNSARGRIYGWDLLELAEPPDTSFRRELRANKKSSLSLESLSWLPLARHVPVYFCDNLGDVITSGSSACCEKVWPGKQLLVASLHAMQHLYQRKADCKHVHLECGLVWELRDSNPTAGPICDTTHCSHLERDARRIFQDGIQTFLAKHKCCQLVSIHSPPRDGAVVFGAETSLVEKASSVLLNARHLTTGMAGFPCSP